MKNIKVEDSLHQQLKKASKRTGRSILHIVTEAIKKYLNTLSTLTLCFLMTSCAMMMNGSKQQVFIKGGPENGIVKLKTPDGTFEIDGGSDSIMLSRTRSDIPIKVVCPDGKKKSGTIQTRFDWVKGGLLNVFNGGFGWIVDPFTNNAFLIENLSLMNYCKPKSPKKGNNQQRFSNKSQIPKRGK